MGITAHPLVDENPILSAVQDMYTEVADHPAHEFHFPTGREACLFVGYPEEDLSVIPEAAVQSFAGVGYPFMVEAIRRGDVVVDIGSGSGVDVTLAAHRTGEEGRVIGIDITPAMIAKARANLSDAGIKHAEIVEGRADDIPLEDGVADVVTSNGVINLVPDKRRVFSEIRRILKPGGRLQLADIVLSRPVSHKSKANPQLWAECVVGAEPEELYLEVIRTAGFDQVKVIDHFEYFERSTNESTKASARGLGAHTIVVSARCQ